MAKILNGDFVISTILRTAVIYVSVIVAIRIMGKRQISDMQPTELVITILISEIAAIPLQDSSKPVLNGIVAIFMLAVLEITLSVLSLKSQLVRRAMSGKTAIIISDGKIDQAAMKKVRMTLPDLMEQLRSKDVFNINHVAYAILEVNGELNVILKDKYSAATKADVTDSTSQSTLQRAVVCDGIFMGDAIQSIGYSKEDIKEILKSKNISAENVFLMTVDCRGNSTLIMREAEK